jgi:membrane-bound lytic murein transglycosylase D
MAGVRKNPIAWRRRVIVALLTAALANAQTPPPKAAEPKTEADDLYRLGKQLFEDYAPPEVKAEYEWPSKEQWDAFLVRVQAALQGDSLEDLAQYAPQARSLLTTLRAAGTEPEVADWLEQRLDEIEGAQQAQTRPPGMPPATPPRPSPVRPGAPKPATPAPNIAKAVPGAPRIPYYDLWLARVKARPVPERAAALMPTLRTAFSAEGVPPALAWLAEAESSLNPSARSPSGAKGLFQLMPTTAQTLGLSTFLPDERTQPEKSARAAAHYLRELHGKFGDWPLALAAYNAGEGRVSRALASRKAKDFAGIADALPAETRMYVPKVCALVATRTGTQLASL